MLRRKTVVDKVFPLLTEFLPESITDEMLHQYNDKAFLYDPNGHTGAAGTYYCLKCKSSGITQLQVPKCPHANGKPVLRLVIPDAKNRLPEEGADYPYCLQALATPVFYIGTGLCKCADDDDEN